MMRYFQAVPMDIYEAARIDGAGHVRMIFSMVFPLAKSGIATITMFYAVVRWNEYFKASIYLTEESQNHPAGDPASVCLYWGIPSRSSARKTSWTTMSWPESTMAH